MRIDRILDEQRPVFSFEFFPPRTDEGQRTLEATLAELKEDRPEYVSVTYGAGGSTRERTVEITKWIKQDLGIEAMAHLSCVGEPTERLVEILEEIEAAGIENVLALRGDPPRGETEWRPHPGGLHYSVELIELMRSRFDFCIGAACFPEVHP
jgi:methylenetetrahydrofolate reductase (NADPH)